MKALLALILSSALASLIGIVGTQPAPRIKSITASAEQIKTEVRRERKKKAHAAATKMVARFYRGHGCAETYAAITVEVAEEVQLSPRLLAAVVFTESTCRANAVSGRDSVGLMQVNPRVWKYNRAELKDPKRGLEIGARILKRYIREFGLVEGLHHYNGMGNSTNEYATKVLTAAGIVVS